MPFPSSLVPLLHGNWNPPLPPEVRGGPTVEEVRSSIIWKFLLSIYNKLLLFDIQVNFSTF